MARNVTTSELRSFSANLAPADLQKSLITASISQSASAFLSHSSKDKDLVIGAMQVIQNHGGIVYVDEIDPEMPPYTTDETAALLKQRIIQTKRFVLLTSSNSKDSRWVPWELGIADGAKGLGKIAIFPASDTEGQDSWTSWEYLGLYRRIVWGKLEGHPNNLWMVLDHKANTAVTLRSWLSGY
ncbi:toll/interleukin-1 receptor domain-containing protein [Pectobacterium fontis]|uniref:TIR domain-containing protein n=1 Tax=Pectobacterium fontis TaxID=2558042 RepID=A0A7V8IM53_9GAMM|nr:toll/interleukin-1 receptor domain-containing protein [Pectobacterium fontis]KHN56275.1 hypothetical protein OI69_01550 [Pectobacterium fontis]